MPLIDLFNRHATPNLAAAHVEGDAFVLRTSRWIKAGEEASVRYGGQHGALPNSRLLMDYGFCDDSSSSGGMEQPDFVTLPLSAPTNRADPHQRLRQQAIADLLPLRLGYRYVHARHVVLERFPRCRVRWRGGSCAVLMAGVIRRARDALPIVTWARHLVREGVCERVCSCA